MALETNPSSGTDGTADNLRAVLAAAERFAAAVEARSIALMLRLDVTMAQLRALTTIRRRGRANGRELAAALRLTPGAVVAVCDHLEGRGYLRRVADADDRRITWFVLTEQGVAALKASPATDVAKSRTKTVLAGLTKEEREGFIRVANAFADAVQSVLRADGDGDSDGTSAR